MTKVNRSRCSYSSWNLKFANSISQLACRVGALILSNHTLECLAAIIVDNNYAAILNVLSRRRLWRGINNNCHLESGLEANEMTGREKEKTNLFSSPHAIPSQYPCKVAA